MDDAPKPPTSLRTPASRSNADLFVRALWPDRHWCLGRRLMPLTIGHLLLLRRVGSPLASGLVPDPADLALAVFICSRPWRRALAAVERPALSLRLLVLGLRASWGMQRAVQSLTRYLKSSLEGPRWWPVPRPGGSDLEMRSPYWATILVALQSDLRMTHEEALDVPVALALWKIAVMREREGQVQLISDDEREVLAVDEPFGQVERPVHTHRN